MRASKTSEPVTSEGIRSGVNCSRLNSRSSARGQRPHQQRLGHAGHALEQDVAAAEQRHTARDSGVLADHHLGHLVADGQERGAGALRRRRTARAGRAGTDGVPVPLVPRMPRLRGAAAGGGLPASGEGGAGSAGAAAGVVGWSVMGGGPSPRGR